MCLSDVEKVETSEDRLELRVLVASGAAATGQGGPERAEGQPPAGTVLSSRLILGSPQPVRNVTPRATAQVEARVQRWLAVPTVSAGQRAARPEAAAIAGERGAWGD